MIAAWLATLATLGGAMCLYIALPHQVIVAKHAPKRLWAWAGAALLAAALALLLTVQGPATAVFTWSTGAMLVWSIVPVVARWWRFREEPAQ